MPACVRVFACMWHVHVAAYAAMFSRTFDEIGERALG